MQWIRVPLLLVFMLPLVSHAKELTLSAAGRTDYAIAAPGDHHPYAVSQLRHYFHEITGAELAARAGEGKRIVFTSGESLGLKLGDDDYVLLNRADDIVIAADSDRAALFAVYDLLERLGCRWLAPRFAFYDGRAEIVPKTPNLSIELPSNIVVQKPAFPLRKLDVAEGLSHDATNLQQLIEWMPKARFNTLVVPSSFGANGRVQWDKWREAMTPEIRKRGLILEVGGHGYQNFLAAAMPAQDGKGTMFDVHSEWFGMDEKGQRRKLKSRVFCTSNADAVAFLTKNVLQYVKDRPEIDIFDFWPPDGADWCTCDACAALGDPQDRQALLANHVLAAMTDAGLRTRLEIIAYSEALLPPQRVKLDPRILVDFCPINQCFEVPIDDPSSTRNAEYVQAVRAWREQFPGDIGLYSYYRKYAWRSAPAVIPHYISDDLRFYQSLPLQAIHVYAEPGDWRTYELNYYSLGKLGWDPQADVDAIVRNFASARYDDAEMGAAMTTLGDVVRTLGSLPFTSMKSPEQIAAGEARLRELAGKLEPSSPPALMFEYAIRDLEVQQLRSRKAPEADVRAKVELLVEFLTANQGEGVFILFGQNHLDRFLRKYGLTK